MSREILREAPVALCHLLSPYSDKETVESLIQRLNHDDALQDRVIELANRHFLVSVLYYQIKSHQLTEQFKPELLEYMQAMAQFMSDRNRQLTRQLIDIVKIFNESGITPLILKGGAVLFSDLYPDRGSRFMSDLDILLPVGKVSAAKVLLEKNGYEIPESYPSITITRNSHHIEPLCKDGEPGVIELHLTPLIRKHESLLSHKECFDHGAPIDELSRQGLNAIRMSQEHQVLHCFIHSELSYGNYNLDILGLRQLDYFVRLLNKYSNTIDWDYVVSKINTGKERFAFNQYLYKANKLFNAQFPDVSRIINQDGLDTQYQNSFKSCYPKEYPLWRAKRILYDVSRFLNKDSLEVSYQIKDSRDLWNARKKRVGTLLKKYRNPSKVLERVSYGFQRHS